MIWSVDGLEWNIPCQIKRVAEVAQSSISGLMMNKTYFNDVIGTYLKYDVAIAVPRGYEEEYSRLYEVLTDPEPYHDFTMPYNEQTVTFRGRVESMTDEWSYTDSNGNWWKGIRFTAIGSVPQKVKDGSTIVNYGLTPFPDEESAVVGTYWYLASTGWEELDIEDGDDTYY